MYKIDAFNSSKHPSPYINIESFEHPYSRISTYINICISTSYTKDRKTRYCVSASNYNHLLDIDKRLV